MIEFDCLLGKNLLMDFKVTCKVRSSLLADSKVCIDFTYLYNLSVETESKYRKDHFVQNYYTYKILIGTLFIYRKN